jgi:hypothetical protein
VTTVAGCGALGFSDGLGTGACLRNTEGAAVDAVGNIYLADSGNNRIRKVAPTGLVVTLAGGPTAALADGPGSTARFSYPTGVAVDSAGLVHVADSGNARVRLVSPLGVVSTSAALTAYDVVLNGKGDVCLANPAGRAVTSSPASFQWPASRVFGAHTAQWLRASTVAVCTSCTVGTYSGNNGGASACTICLAGTYGPTAGSSSAPSAPTAPSTPCQAPLRAQTAALVQAWAFFRVQRHF